MSTFPVAQPYPPTLVFADERRQYGTRVKSQRIFGGLYQVATVTKGLA